MLEMDMFSSDEEKEEKEKEYNRVRNELLMYDSAGLRTFIFYSTISQ